MAQAATAIDPAMLRKLELRCANIRKLAFRLDQKCWQTERVIERLGLEPCDRDYEKSEMAYEILTEWCGEVERHIKGGAQ